MFLKYWKPSQTLMDQSVICNGWEQWSLTERPQKCERHFAAPECSLIAVGRGTGYGESLVRAAADLVLYLYSRQRAAVFPTVGDVQGEKQRVPKGMSTDLPPTWSTTGEATDVVLTALALETMWKASIIARTPTQLSAISNASLLCPNHTVSSNLIPAPSTC